MSASPAWVGALLLLILHAGFACIATVHALLSKSDPRSAFGWIIVCWVFPLAGPLLYLLFGINRVRSRARQLRSGLPTVREPLPPASSDDFATQLTHIGDAVTQWSRVAGNAIEPLENGENAFPRMLSAIGAARRSVWLATYIFETDAVGRQFVNALAAAVARAAYRCGCSSMASASGTAGRTWCRYCGVRACQRRASSLRACCRRA